MTAGNKVLLLLFHSIADVFAVQNTSMGSIAIFSVNVNSTGDYMKWKDVHDYFRKDSYRMSLFITRNARRVTNRFVSVLHGFMIPVSLELKRAKLE